MHVIHQYPSNMNYPSNMPIKYELLRLANKEKSWEITEMLLTHPHLISITLSSLRQGWGNHWNISFSSSLYSKKAVKSRKKKNRSIDIKDIKHIFTTIKLRKKNHCMHKTIINAVQLYTGLKLVKYSTANKMKIFQACKWNIRNML